MTGSLNLPKLSLVLGGARSGKSRLAEGLVFASGRTRHYIATAEAWDDEMRALLFYQRAKRKHLMRANRRAVLYAICGWVMLASMLIEAPRRTQERSGMRSTISGSSGQGRPCRWQ